jgi:23S rRNA pseudouridine1911/1915/1917 synthase
MASLGHPLIADAVYGGKQMSGMDRQALHACRLAFTHPVTAKEMVFEVSPPSDIMQFIGTKGLRYNPASGFQPTSIPTFDVG